ncbi:hypothetical protein RB195_014766 [Necator americanus]|uniref:Globin family profile domain-containing protein n=1 Tax=Necator americanus TaxID=51031 RepID=A0ABR1E1H1_NECAM
MGCGPSTVLSDQEQQVIVATWKALRKNLFCQRGAGTAALPPPDSHSVAAIHGKIASRKGEWACSTALG